ncbi:MAG: CehA/McbA family metallohydrolase [Thermoplasmata archaeon]
MSDGARFDLHVHSGFSPDSRLPLESVVARLPYVGLKGFALTDHNSVRGHAALAELRGKNPAYLLIPGVEVSTSEGHLLAYGVRESPPLHRSVAETIEWVRERGGEAVLAHPFRRSHGVGRAVAESTSAAGIETRNGHNSEIANLRAEDVAARRNLSAVGGSDAHSIADLGRSYTEFDAPIASLDDLLEGLRRHTTSGAGKSMPLSGRLRWGIRTGLLLAGRGFRPI